MMPRITNDEAEIIITSHCPQYPDSLKKQCAVAMADCVNVMIDEYNTFGVSPTGGARRLFAEATALAAMLSSMGEYSPSRLLFSCTHWARSMAKTISAGENSNRN